MAYQLSLAVLVRSENLMVIQMDLRGESHHAEVLKELDKIVDYLTIYNLIMARTQSSLSVKKRTPSVSLENNFFLQPALSQVSPVVVNANARASALETLYGGQLILSAQEPSYNYYISPIFANVIKGIRIQM